MAISILKIAKGLTTIVFEPAIPGFEMNILIHEWIKSHNIGMEGRDQCNIHNNDIKRTIGCLNGEFNKPKTFYRNDGFPSIYPVIFVCGNKVPKPRSIVANMTIRSGIQNIVIAELVIKYLYESGNLPCLMNGKNTRTLSCSYTI